MFWYFNNVKQVVNNLRQFTTGLYIPLKKGETILHVKDLKEKMGSRYKVEKKLLRLCLSDAS